MPFTLAEKIIAGKVGREVAADEVVVAPASRKVMFDAGESGVMRDFVEFGAAVQNTGCGACVGGHGGILGDGERCLATSNRNFKGWMGSPSGGIILGSPATAAAATGEVRDAMEVL